MPTTLHTYMYTYTCTHTCTHHVHMHDHAHTRTHTHVFAQLCKFLALGESGAVDPNVLIHVCVWMDLSMQALIDYLLYSRMHITFVGYATGRACRPRATTSEKSSLCRRSDFCNQHRRWQNWLAIHSGQMCKFDLIDKYKFAKLI